MTVNQWCKYAVLLLFKTANMDTIEHGPFEYADKIPLKSDYMARGVRVVDHADGLVEVALVVDADLGDHEGRVRGTDAALADAHLGKLALRAHHAVHPPSTTRLWPVQ